MPLSIDGSVAVNSSSGSVTTGVMTCVNAGNVIVVAVSANSNTPSAVTATGATFTKLTQTSGSLIQLWYGYAAGVFNSAISVAAAGTSFITVHACAISGCPSTGYLDTNVSNPNVGSSDPRTISTTAADTIVIGAFRQSVNSAPTQGSGFTKLFGAGYSLLEYKIVSSPQTNLSVTDGAAGDANGGIAAAFVLAAPAGGPFPHYAGAAMAGGMRVMGGGLC